MNLGAKAAPAVPAVAELLTNGNKLLRDYAITTLTKLGPPAKMALPSLRRLAASDPDEDIRSLAKSAVEDLEAISKQSDTTESAPNTPGEEATKPDKMVSNSKGYAQGLTLNRPPLLPQQGRYFSYLMPQGWKASESTNGLEMNSPDGKRQASFVLLLHNSGSSTPEQFLARFAGLMKLSNFRILDSKPVPSNQQGVSISQMEMSYSDPRLGTRHGGSNVAVSNAWGMHDAYQQLYSSTPEDWPQDMFWLPVITRSVRITNFTEVAGNNTLLRPQNNPLDNSGLIKSWQEKGLSQDRISQAWREGMMGYERLKSPTTGRIYELPLEHYDGSFGGYHNPDLPDEMLSRAPAGQ
jgi:hypothetical protein